MPGHTYEHCGELFVETYASFDALADLRDCGLILTTGRFFDVHLNESTREVLYVASIVM